MAAIEALEDIKEINARNASVEVDQMLTQQRELQKKFELLQKQLEEDEDEAEIRFVIIIFFFFFLSLFSFLAKRLANEVLKSKWKKNRSSFLRKNVQQQQ